MYKEKEGLLPWIHKFAPRKKVGMLLLCAVSLAVLVWVLFVDKGLVSNLLPLQLFKFYISRSQLVLVIEILVVRSII